MQEQEIKSFYPASAAEWRAWLAEHHHSKPSVWLVCYKKQTGKPTVSWNEAVDEAVCFGWIDSTRKTLDAETFIQFFCKRKSTSVWSKINKEKVERLVAEGRMTPAGYASIEIARQNGSWNILDEVELLTVPEDLQQAFGTCPGAEEFFLGLGRSVRKSILQWLVLAKRPETRQKRIAEIAELAAQQFRPKQFR